MKLHRKVTLKSAIVYTITFAIGVIVGQLLRPKEQIPEEWDWEEWLKTHPPTYDSSGDWDKLVWENPSLEDTQPIG